MIRHAILAALLALTVLLVPHAALAQDSTASSFQAELQSLLSRSMESKRGVVFHLHGEKLPGVVKRLLSDAVLVSNQEHATILIRLDRIDAIELD
jgi:hypothetical protein